MNTPPNRLLKVVNAINQSSYLTDRWKQMFLSLAFNSNIKYAGTTGIAIKSWQPDRTVVHLANQWRIQNHIGGIHACAMAVLAESATGMLFGLHVPDTHLLLLKSLRIQYHKRAVGDLVATATLEPHQIQLIQQEPKGAVPVQVVVTDSEGKEPIECEMIWAWTPKKRNEEASTTLPPPSQEPKK